MVIFNFFFSSRRRHTRYWRDWSSDVCSSDLLLAISLSTTDAVGHLYGPESREIHDQVVRLDRYLGWFLGQLFVRYGAGGVTIVLTADHGVTPYPEWARAHGHPEARRVSLDSVLRDVNRELD